MREACKTKDSKDMVEGMEGKSKLDDLKKDGCDTKEYMTRKFLHQVRDIFRARTSMVEGIKGNFKGMHVGKDMKCDGCKQEQDSQSHVTSCTAYADLREGLDFHQDTHLVNYFKKVIERRES